MHNLFLVCPDCHLEQIIRKEFGSDSIFLTALGAVFSLNTFEYVEIVNQTIVMEAIKHIYIVNDFSCMFLQNATKNRITFDSIIGKSLYNLVNANRSILEAFPDQDKQLIKLAELNIILQGKQLLEAPFIGTKVKQREIELSGLIYNRKINTFKSLQVHF